MSDTPNRKLELIRKLLALAEHEGTPEAEAERAREQATALITKYGVEQAMLQHHGAVREEITSKRVLIQGPYLEEKRTLLRMIALGLGLYSFRVTTPLGNGRKRIEQEICGYPDDIEQVELLYTSLLLQSSNHLRREERYVYWLRGAALKAWKRSWLIGYADRIRERLEEQRAKAAAEAPDAADGTSTELVLLDKSKQIEAWAKANNDLHNLPRRRLSGNAFGDGRRAADRADIGTEGNRVGHSSARVLGR